MNNIPDTPGINCGTARLTSDDLGKALGALGYTFTTTEPLSDKHFPALLGELNLHIGSIIMHLVNHHDPDRIAKFATAGADMQWHDAILRSLVPPLMITTAIKNDFDAHAGQEGFNPGAANIANIAVMTLGLIAEVCRYHGATGPKHDSDEIYRITRQLADALAFIADKCAFEPPRDNT